MDQDKYLVGRLKEYHEIFFNENVHNSANELSEQGKLIFNEFENIKNVIVSWEGEGANTMTKKLIPAIINRLDTVKKNIDNSLVPATQAIEKLKIALETIKTKEGELKEKEKELEKEEKRNVPKKLYKGENRKGEPIYVPNHRYDEWQKKLEELKLIIQNLTTQLEQLKSNCENYIKEVETLENNILNFSFILENAITLSNDNTSLEYFTSQLPNNRILTEDEKKYMTEEEKEKLSKLCEQENASEAIEYMKELDEVIKTRIYNTPIEERGLTALEQEFLNDHEHDNNKLRFFVKGKEIFDDGTDNNVFNGKLTLEEAETVEILVKIPTNKGSNIELCRVGLGRNEASENKILQTKSVDPDRYDKNSALQDTGYFIWTVNAKEEGKGYQISQTVQFNTENKKYYSNKDGNGSFKEMGNLFIEVI